MAYRTFVDAHGVRWTVWTVYPTVTELRPGDAPRTGTTPLGVTPVAGSRAVGAGTLAEPAGGSASASAAADGAPSGARTVVAPGLERGWLAFESETEKRRLAPIPEGWTELSDQALAALCARATPAPRRTL